MTERMTDAELERIVAGDAPSRMSFIVREARRARAAEERYSKALEEAKDRIEGVLEQCDEEWWFMPDMDDAVKEIAEALAEPQP